jgi:hypoxanthine phosphoribosyltransferase
MAYAKFVISNSQFLIFVLRGVLTRQLPTVMSTLYSRHYSNNMSIQHQHTGTLEITWEQFGEHCKDLALAIEKRFQPQCVVGISKGGLPLATVLASMFRIDLYPIRLSYRERDQVLHKQPIWMVPVNSRVAGLRVLLVDEISVSGVTLKLATEELFRKGAAEVFTVTLAIHKSSVKPDIYAIESDALIILPWDKWIIDNGEFTLHPEYAKSYSG